MDVGLGLYYKLFRLKLFQLLTELSTNYRNETKYVKLKVVLLGTGKILLLNSVVVEEISASKYDCFAGNRYKEASISSGSLKIWSLNVILYNKMSKIDLLLNKKRENRQAHFICANSMLQYTYIIHGV